MVDKLGVEYILGFSLQRHKSKKEVMEEIIMKSKLGRVTISAVFLVSSFCMACQFTVGNLFYSVVVQMEKAKQKEEKEKLIDELDKDFMSLVGSQAMESLTKPFEVQQVNVDHNLQIFKH